MLDLRSLTIAIALLSAACDNYTATDGRTLAWPHALTASGRHDLNCPTAHVRVATGYSYSERTMIGVVEGCGVRATYNVIDGELVMTSRFRLDDK